ncbi:DinB family protein [Flavitalea flava]
MPKTTLPEVWLRGPVPGIPPLLQPVAHALLQAREEVSALMGGFSSEHLWDRPAGVASPGFHLQHLTGVLDRLFTYARGEGLNERQLEALGAEGIPMSGQEGGGQPAQVLPDLVNRFSYQVDLALAQLAATPESILQESRRVGRAGIPSTVTGLLFHAAEHTQRHTGQLFVTVKVLSSPGE